jgi:threonine dehydratase
VVAASAGNHAQGVALAAGLLGTAATVFMPDGAPLPKIEATLAYGATVELVGSPGPLTFAHVREYVDEIRTVSEESLSRALLLCLERAKLVVEPAGVASVAALLDEPNAFEPPVVAILSGGNIDPVLLSKVIQYGMVSAGRYLSCRLRIPDRPGELARLLQLVAAQGANVLSVEHSRTGSQLHLGEVEIALSAETRGEEHCEQLLEALREAGHTAIFG